MTKFRRARSIAQGPSDTQARCFFCHRPAPGSPFRSPIPDVAGGRYVICGPACPERPDGARVFSIGTDWNVSA